MKKLLIILITLMAITIMATPITEKHFAILINKYHKDGTPTTIAEYQTMIDFVNAQYNEVTTNADMSVTTNYFMAISPELGYNAYVNLAQTTNLLYHPCISNTANGTECYAYWFWGSQNKRLTKEALQAIKQVFDEKIMAIEYTDDSIDTWMNQGHWVREGE